MLDRTGIKKMQSPQGASVASLLLAAAAVLVVSATTSSCGGDEFSSPSTAQEAGASDGSAGASSEAGAGGATSHGGSDGGAETGKAGGSAGAAGSCSVGICYRDADGDGYGNPAAPDATGCAACAAGYVANKTDCNDDPDYGMNYHPGQTECFASDPGGGWDFNCNGSTDPAAEGCVACGVPSINPRWCDGACGKQVFKQISNYAKCGAAGRLTKVGQTCGDQPACGGTYPLVNDVGIGECAQTCR